MLIKKKLPLIIIAFASIPLIIVSFLIYYYSSHTLINGGKDNLMQIAKVEGDVLTSLINKQKTEVELSAQKSSIVELLEHRIKNNNSDFLNSVEVLKVSNELKNRADKLPELEHSFILDLDGNIICDSKGNIKVSSVADRVYYKEALKDNLVISSTLHSKIDNRPVVVLSAPVKDKEGNIIGVFCNSFYTDFFEKFTSNIKIGKTGYAYIIDNEGMIVTYPEKDKIGEKLNDIKLKSIFDKTKDYDTANVSMDTYNYNNEDKYLAIKIIPDYKWTLAVVQDKEEINGPAKLELYIIVSITALILIVAVITSLAASRAIIYPIDKLIKTMDKTSQGDLTSLCEYESNNEFGRLSDNFNNMIKKLNDSYMELSAVYEELSATEEELRTQYEELMESQEALSISEERYKQALDGINDVVWELDIKSNKFFASDNWYNLTGCKFEHMDIRKFIVKLIVPEFQRSFFKDIHKHIKFKTSFFRSELKIITSNGEIKWILTRGKVIYNYLGKPVKFTGALTDITSTKIAEERIKQLAYCDMLTGLPNRNAFIQDLQEEVSYCSENNKSGALLFIDLDDFKHVNDSLGHDMGDMLLKKISDKLSKAIDKNDKICRFGGDEFLILKKNVKDKEQLERLSCELLKNLENYFEIEGKQIFITSSIGISIFPLDGNDKNIILKNADTAMYSAKEGGKNRYQFYNEEMSKALIRNINIEKSLRAALENDELLLHYQPQVELKSGKIVGAEALLRLRDKDIGFISPSEFIPIAEKTGLILPMGYWVINTSCKQNLNWINRNFNKIRVSVNVSAVQIRQSDFVHNIISFVRTIGVPPEFMEVEITESILMENLESNVKVLKQLRDFGIRTSLDDFGTGYSSLNYLRKLPIDTLKIDKSFIDDICVNKMQEAIVDSIIEMAHKMDVEVVAEGVETEEQLNMLREKNCDIVQGYIFSKPQCAEAIEELLINGII